MRKTQTHYYIIDDNRRLENAKEVREYIGISANVFKRMRANGFIKRIDTNNATNSSIKLHVKNEYKQGTQRLLDWQICSRE